VNNDRFMLKTQLKPVGTGHNCQQLAITVNNTRKDGINRFCQECSDQAGIALGCDGDNSGDSSLRGVKTGEKRVISCS